MEWIKVSDRLPKCIGVYHVITQLPYGNQLRKKGASRFDVEPIYEGEHWDMDHVYEWLDESLSKSKQNKNKMKSVLITSENKAKRLKEGMQKIYSIDTVTGNKLIAEFMGMYVAPFNGSYHFVYHNKERSKYPATWLHMLEEMKYHTSWDWVMPVVDDIYYSRRFPTGVQSSEISSQPNRLYKNIESGLLHLSINQTWLAVVQFIQWYNNQQAKK